MSVLACLAVALLTGCAAGAPPAEGRIGGDRPPPAPKTLRIAFQGFMEPKGGVIGYGTAGGFDPLEHFLTFHSSLTVFDPEGELTPRLAEKVPSVQDGDWTVNPDGTMEVTWRLRPGLRWHDGQPLTADDFVFGLQVILDPEVPAGPSSWQRRIAELIAVDARTLVIRWSEPTFLAGGSGARDVPALPRHILGQLYDSGDKHAFLNAPYWTTEFVGLGPYRLNRWQLGSFIEGLAFDGYVLGRPRIDRVLFNYVGDVNAIVAAVLGGEQDMVPMGARFDATQLVAVQSGWGPDGGQAFLVPFGIRTIWLQFRDPLAPWVRDVQVRRALVHATDRQGMSDALQHGLTTPADTFVMVTDSVFPLLERRGLRRYPFDEDRARRLMAEAGWRPGPDGQLRDAGGQALSLDLSATAQGSNVQEIETVANQWRGIGIQANPVPLPPQMANLDERKNTVRGGFLWPWSPSLTAPENLTSHQVPSERTAWKGPNYGGYRDPAYDRLVDRYTTTLLAAERRGVLADIMVYLAQEVPVIPIYYYGVGVVARRGLDGPGMIPPVQTASTWNIHVWELR